MEGDSFAKSQPSNNDNDTAESKNDCDFDRKERKEDKMDIDKYLHSFANDVGCTINDIVNTLNTQSDETKEKNWKKLAKEEEITSFVAIYTIVLGMIACTLKMKNISKKPPKECVKALTYKLIKKLPKYDDKPILTEWEYMNCLDGIFEEIAKEYIKEYINIDISTQSPPQQQQQKEGEEEEEVIDIKAEESNLIKSFENEGNNNNNKKSSDIFGALNSKTNTNKTLENNLYHIPVYTNKSTKNNNKKSLDIFGALKSKNNLDHVPTTINTNKTTKNNAATYNVTADVKNDGDKTRCDDLKAGYRVTNCMCWCRIISLFIVIIICSVFIGVGQGMVNDGEKYESESTQEICTKSYESLQCSMSCDCDSYKEEYGDRVTECTYNSEGDTCHSFKYKYTATANNKCGSISLFSYFNQDDYGDCGAFLTDIGTEFECYVLECDDQEYTTSTPASLKGGGQIAIAMGSIVLSIVACCNLIICPMFCGKICVCHGRQSCC